MMPAASAQPRIHHRRFLMVRRVADSLGPAAKVSVCTLHSLVIAATAPAVTISDPIGYFIGCEEGHMRSILQLTCGDGGFVCRFSARLVGGGVSDGAAAHHAHVLGHGGCGLIRVP